jgi:hypothetical protein
MAKTVSMVGIDPLELGWIRMLLFLLRHSDPTVQELTRQAVLYLMENAAAQKSPKNQSAERYFSDRNLVS